jgi:hypothetical protein
MALIVAGSFLFGLGVAMKAPVFMILGMVMIFFRAK